MSCRFIRQVQTNNEVLQQKNIQYFSMLSIAIDHEILLFIKVI